MSRWTENDYARYVSKLSGLQALVDSPPSRIGKLKFGNRRAEVDGIKFDSEKEAARYQDLKLMETGGLISGLMPHPKYGLHAVTPSGDKVQVGTYTPDFQYREGGVMRIEDVKANVTKTEAYRLRKRIFEAEYGLKVTEV